MNNVNDIATVVKHYAGKNLKKACGVDIISLCSEDSSFITHGSWGKNSFDYTLVFKIKHIGNSVDLVVDARDSINSSLESILRLNRGYSEKWYIDDLRDDFKIEYVRFLNKGKTTPGVRGNLHYIKLKCKYYIYDDSTLDADFQSALREARLAQLGIKYIRIIVY